MNKELIYTYIGSEIFVIVGLLFLSSKIEVPEWILIFAIFLVVLLTAGCSITIIARTKSLSRMKSMILERLKHEGYNCHMEEGCIMLTKQDRHIMVEVFESSNPHIFNLVFQDRFSVGNPDDINWVGSMVLSEVANNKFRTKVRGEDGRYACTYETAIENTDDFMTEFSTAWYKIMSTIGWMADNWDEAIRRWPAQKEDETSKEEHKVGFKV